MKTDTKIEIDSARKATEVDGIIDKYVWEPVAMVFSKLFIKYKFVPNTISIVSLVIGIIGSALFYFQNIVLNLLGIILFFMSAVFDTCDGQVARLTNNKSPMGRFLDGFCDSMVEVCFYLALTLRLMHEPIPFTNTLWGFWIWPISAFCGLYCHRRQCYMADYYRNLHLFFLNGKNGNELSRSKKLEAEFAQLDKKTPFIDKAYRFIYKDYTKKQENLSPGVQLLLDKIEANGNQIPDWMREEFLEKSRKYIEYTSILTYNVRTIALFIAVATGLHFWFFVFVVTVLEAMMLRMINRYERIARDLYSEFNGAAK